MCVTGCWQQRATAWCVWERLGWRRNSTLSLVRHPWCPDSLLAAHAAFQGAVRVGAWHTDVWLVGLSTWVGLCEVASKGSGWPDMVT